MACCATQPSLHVTTTDGRSACKRWLAMAVNCSEVCVWQVTTCLNSGRCHTVDAAAVYVSPAYSCSAIEVTVEQLSMYAT